MVTGRACPECPAGPAMDYAGTAPAPGGHRVVVECPNCGHRERVNPEDGPDDGAFEW